MRLTRPRLNLSNNTPGAIVLGGNFLGLAVVRALAAQGVPTWVIDADPSKCIAQFSRYTRRFLVADQNVHDILISEGRKRHLYDWVLFPVNDEYVEVVARNHQSLSSIFRLTTPPIEVTRFALDKRLTYRRAAELGIATPWTSTGDNLDNLDLEKLPYPAILKPAVNHHFFPHTNIKALPVSGPSEMQSRHSQMAKYIPSEEILIQERIPGGGERQFSFCALFRAGKTIASLVARRQRQYPVEFGNASTFVETTSVPEVEDAGRRFLESIGFDGIAEIEFKFDSRDSKYKILDVNSRAWGWHSLGKAAGIDFAYLLWQQALGRKLTLTPHQHRAAAWMREITDVIAIAKSRNPISEMQKLARAMTTGRLTFATFDLLDPVPFFAEVFLWMSAGLSRRKKAKEMLQFDPLSAE